jgi:hypothetical protein
MDLSFLIPSKVRRLVLDYFVQYPDAQVGIRELARELKISPQESFRELVNLEGWGILFSSRRGLERAFRLNKKFPLYPPVAELFRRLREENNRRPEVIGTLDWKKMSKEYDKIPVPSELIPGLTAKRRKPRSFVEEKMMRRKGMLP